MVNERIYILFIIIRTISLYNLFFLYRICKLFLNKKGAQEKWQLNNLYQKTTLCPTTIKKKREAEGGGRAGRDRRVAPSPTSTHPHSSHTKTPHPPPTKTNLINLPYPPHYTTDNHPTCQHTPPDSKHNKKQIEKPPTSIPTPLTTPNPLAYLPTRAQPPTAPISIVHTPQPAA